ncbi:MAG TPA: hypothetical protein DCL21_00790 [Alphaproteobacteria bacterium]|nr:hypothetical protein [Alphaproteobacteria bacterium]
MAITEIQIKRGDSFSRPITLKDSGGVGIDITGYKFYFTVKKCNDNVKDDSSAVIQKDITVFSDPTNGKFMLDLTPTETDIAPAEYYYDIQYKTASGDIRTITEQPLFIVLADTTRRVD